MNDLEQLHRLCIMTIRTLSIYAVQQATDAANASARIVVQNALFLGRRRMSTLTIPWCTSTDPEIYHLGLHVRQARERNIPVKTFTAPMHDVDRAIADGEEECLREDPRAGRPDSERDDVARQPGACLRCSAGRCVNG